jgi:hypothetical protein
MSESFLGVLDRFEAERFTKIVEDCTTFVCPSGAGLAFTVEGLVSRNRIY